MLGLLVRVEGRLLPGMQFEADDETERRGSGTPPGQPQACSHRSETAPKLAPGTTNAPDRRRGRLAEPLVGIEPTTYSLRVNRSGRLS
ncbi:hypothetical protein BN11_1980005 [Nostocoides australiense Ben110]|uniref:Uncharacterized protein n=1 Tax=Nostocoides australiense Ben110 TaxID=1193182 RepID=W6K2Y1_9MICO|nr:hypothetical protein BN11_1980005 [Tetrasphaera australiensis Ben110]